MALTKIIPKVFYSDIQVGLHLFEQCLSFKVVYQDDYLYVLSRDAVTIQLMPNDELAKESRPEIRIETDDIRKLYQQVKDGFPELLHPNLNVVKIQPWGLMEFALIDGSGVCVVIQQPLSV